MCPGRLVYRSHGDGGPLLIESGDAGAIVSGEDVHG